MFQSLPPIPLDIDLGVELLDYYFFNIYLFVWLRRVLVAARGIFTATRGIFWCGARALECAGSVAAARRLPSCGVRHVGS